MKPERFDIVVIGLGAMGSAACYHLAERGCSVLGLDQFTVPHPFGSSHGETRIIREAYFEHPLYVPLVQHAYELWARLEEKTGRRLLLKTGGLMIGIPDGAVYSGAKRSAETHRLPHEILSAADVRRRFPALQPDDSMAAIWEPRAGILFPELCIESHLELARKHGAILQFNEPVVEWKPAGDNVDVTTPSGRYRARQLLLTAGAWTTRLLPGLQVSLRVERQVLFWFDPLEAKAMFNPKECPIHVWEYQAGQFFYGFPDLGTGIKIARHHQGEPSDPSAVRREVDSHDVNPMRELVKRFLPRANGTLRSSTVCLYTNTPDGHFLIDRHPECEQVLVASPCSGHGFKFSSALGSVLADLLLKGTSPFDLSLFRWRDGLSHQPSIERDPS